MSMYNYMIRLLHSSAAPFIIHEHEVIQTVPEALEKVPDWAEKLIKTVAFQIKDGDYVLAAVGARSRIDYRKLAAVVDVNRRNLRSLSPLEVASQLEAQVGGVGPFAWRADSRVIFDRQAMTLGTIYCGTGRNTHTLEIDIQDLVQVVAGGIADIIRH